MGTFILAAMRDPHPPGGLLKGGESILIEHICEGILLSTVKDTELNISRSLGFNARKHFLNLDCTYVFEGPICQTVIYL